MVKLFVYILIFMKQDHVRGETASEEGKCRVWRRSVLGSVIGVGTHE